MTSGIYTPVATPLQPAPTDPELQDKTALLDAIAECHTRTVDATSGFETMIAKAEPSFRPIAERFHDLHRQQTTRLANMLISNGRQANDSGSFMSNVNQAVVTVRSWFDEIDADVLKQVRSGEAPILEAFDKAIERSADAPVRNELVAMRRELATLLDDPRGTGQV